MKKNNSSILFPIQTFAPGQAPTSAFAPGLWGIYTNVNLQKATRLAQELFIKG